LTRSREPDMQSFNGYSSCSKMCSVINDIPRQCIESPWWFPVNEKQRWSKDCASAKCQNRIWVFAGFHQFPSFLKLRNPETMKPIATVSSLSVLFSGDIDSFSGFHKFHRFPYLILPKVSWKWDISPQVTGFPGFKLVFGGFLSWETGRN